MANHKNQDGSISDNKHNKPEAPACCGPVTRDKSGNRKNRSFLEGCLFALCCCWLWDACFDL